jgi:hypothetical protein
MSKTVRLKRTSEGYKFVGSYEIAALLSTNLNTPALQSKNNRHIFVVRFKEDRYQLAASVLAIVGVDTIEIVDPLQLSPKLK